VFLLILASALTIYLASQQPGYPWGGDSALEIMHARNLATGQPYARTHYLYDDEAWMEGTPSFPPGLPLLMAPVYLRTGLNLGALRDYCAVLLAAALIPVFFFFRRSLSPWFACLALALAAINRFPLGCIVRVNSECAYLLFSFLGLGAAIWIYDTRRNETGPLAWGAMIGALAAYTCATRSIGVALMGAIGLYDLYRNRRVTRFLLASGLVFAVLFCVTNLLLHNDAGYRTQFRFDLSIGLSNVKNYVIESTGVWWGIPGGRRPRVVLWLLTTAIALYGLRKSVERRGPGLTEFYVVCYLGVLYFYWVANGRYLIPLIPIYFLYLFRGSEALWARPAGQPALRWALASLILVMATAAAGAVTGIDRSPLRDGVHTATYRQAVGYIRAETPGSARIVSDSARFLALFTDRDSLFYPIQEDPKAIAAFLARMRADYVLVSERHEDDRVKLIPALALGKWQLVFQNAEYALFCRGS
jgi:hypothetical protein